MSIDGERLTGIELPEIREAEWPQHPHFLTSLDYTGQALDAIDIPRRDWFVISGGNVALRQMSAGVPDRDPTDLDIVLYHQDPEHGEGLLKALYSELQRRQAQFNNTALIWEPRMHHGYKYVNPILETGTNGVDFPVDFLTYMMTQFPDPTYIPALNGQSYVFPVDDRRLFDAADIVSVNGKPVQLAPPGFVAFYKLTMNRNGSGANGTVPKQDDMDMLRLHSLGAFESDSFREVLALMAYGDTDLMDQLDASLRSKLV